MWTCRKCSAEVEDNFEICWSCGTSVDGAQDPAFRRFERDEDVPGPAVTVAPQTAVATDKLVPVATYWVAGQAHEVQCILEADGIPVTVAYEFGVATDWFLDNATGSIQLQVAEKDVEKARKVLADHPKEATPLPPAPPKPPEPDQETRFKDQPWLAPLPKDLSREETLKFLEAQVSALIDSKDVPDWKVNPAFHPDVMAFIQKHANNVGFVQKAQALQRNRAKYFATMRTQALAPKPPEETDEPKEAPPARPAPGHRLAKALKYGLVTLPLWVLVRLLKWTIVVGVVAVILGLMASLAYRGYGYKQLNDATTDVGKIDEAWQWEYLQATRKEVADKDNAAPLVEALGKELADLNPHPVTSVNLQREVINDPAPNVARHESVVQLMRNGLEKCPAAQQSRLAGLRDGRWPAGAVPTPAGPPSAEEKACRAAAWILAQVHAELAGMEQRGGEALTAVQAILVVGRSNGDDPAEANQLVRLDCDRVAAASLQRTLAQLKQPPAAELAALQERLTQEANDSQLTQALRGRRFRLYELWPVAAASDANALAILEPDLRRDGFQLRTEGTAAAPVERWLRGGVFSMMRAQCLRRTTEDVALGKLALEEQINKCRAGGVADDVVQLAAPFHQTQTLLRCAAAAVAVERYRLAQEKWPTTWEALVPKYLSAIPVDPFDGKPLRLKPSPDGVVIYSVGPDGADDGGQVLYAGDATTAPKDLGFRLWNVDQRNLPSR